VHPGDAQAVAGDPDVRHEPLVPGRGEGLDRPAGGEDGLELVVLDEVVQLDEVDVIDVHPGE
jgi:hypothetical protein